MRCFQKTKRNQAGSLRGFTLAEVVVAIAITAILLGSLINGYIVTVRRAEWTAMSEAAQLSVVQRLEQARSARWDLTASVPIDDLVSTNFPTVKLPLYTPMGGTNVFYCTNVTTITQISDLPPVKLIRSDCSWPFINGRTYTNSLMLYRSPDP